MNPTSFKTTNIHEIALYTRKSRGEDEEVLAKHKKLLVDFAETHRLKYVLYNEVASGDSIAFRPKMQELLADIRRNMYDAVLVVDYDRLGRGDKEDQAIIEKTFAETNTYILTPNKAYDLNNESDALLSDVQGLLARFEYQQIKKRFKRGKVIGAKMGHWTNGPAPFPYIYDPALKKLVIDEKKRFLYQEIKERALNGESLASIRFDLNKRGYLTNKGKYWSENAIHRLLTNPTHQGHIVHGKTSGSGHKGKKTQPLKVNPKEEWILTKNIHEALVTEEEAIKIQAILRGNRLIAKKARKATYPLSGLIKCGKCGYAINFTHNNRNGRLNYFLKKCLKANHFGEQCSNSGVKQELVLEVLKLKLQQYENELVKKNEDIVINQNVRLKQELMHREKELLKHELALTRIREMYEEQEYSRDEFLMQKEKRSGQILLLKSEIENIKGSIRLNEKFTNEDRLKEINLLSDLWDKLYKEDGQMTVDGAKKINTALRKVIDKIVYTRDGNDISIEVNFL